MYIRETGKGALEGKIYKHEKYSNERTDRSDRLLLHDILD